MAAMTETAEEQARRIWGCVQEAAMALAPVRTNRPEVGFGGLDVAVVRALAVLAETRVQRILSHDRAQIVVIEMMRAECSGVEIRAQGTRPAEAADLGSEARHVS